MLRIEIDMKDVHGPLGAGRRVVTHLGFERGRLLCRDAVGNTARVPANRFRFVRVLDHKSRTTAAGHVEVELDGGWHDLGPLSSEDHRHDGVDAGDEPDSA